MTSVQSIQKRLLKNSSWLLAAQIATGLLTLVQSIMITRALGLAGYGVFAVVVTYTLTITQLCNSRIWETIIKFVPEFRAKHDDRRAAATLQLCYLAETVSGLLAIGVLLTTADLAARAFLQNADLAHLLRLYALFALCDIPTEATSGLLRVADRFRWLSVQNAGIAAIKTLGTGFVCLQGPSIEGILAAQLIASAIGSLITLAMAQRAARHLGLDVFQPRGLSAIRGDLHRLLRFMMWSNLTATSRIFTSKVDVLVLGLFASPAAVGAYNLARRLVNQITVLAAPLYSAIYPEMSKLIAVGDHAQLKQLQTQVSRVALPAAIAACLVATLFAPWMIPALFSQQFDAAVPLFQILVWQLVWLPLIWFPGYLQLLGRAGTLTALTWIDSLLYVLLLVALVPAFADWGAAVATTARQLLWIVMACGLLLQLARTKSLRPATTG